MNSTPLSNVLTILLGAAKRLKRPPVSKGATICLSLYRYDSTGRLVHYGPENEVLEHDSGFRITGVERKSAGRTALASQRQGHS